VFSVITKKQICKNGILNSDATKVKSLNSQNKTPVFRDGIPVLGVKTKLGWYVF